MVDNPWALYDELIAGVPEDVLVRDYCYGKKWSFVEAECGMGVSYSVAGGALFGSAENFRGKPLRALAELSKSWCFEDASLGVAALNAWYSRKSLVDALGAEYEECGRDPEVGKRMDAFTRLRPEIEAVEGASVCVVGHFPHVERIAEYANLTVLERNCRDRLDAPDSACEYVLPEQDYVFLTGTTVINKTAPRLLQLSANAKVGMLGPSVVPAEALMRAGVGLLASSVVVDPEQARYAVCGGAYQSFKGSLLRFIIESR